MTPQAILEHWAAVEADFRRYYHVEPFRLGWREFRVMLRGFPADSVFLAHLWRESRDASGAAVGMGSAGGGAYPDWQRALDKHIGRTPGERTVVTPEAFMGIVNG